MPDRKISDRNSLQRRPSFFKAILIYLGYLAIFFGTWYVNGADYLNIGNNIETVKLWYAIPTLLGSLFLVLVISFSGWWRMVLFDKTVAKPTWVWVLPAMMALLIIAIYMQMGAHHLSSDLLLWLFLGSIGVGFGEEIICRGTLLVALSSKFTEGRVWLFSSIFFSALHIPNVFFGQSFVGMIAQVILTFIMGSGLYVARRISGTLLLPIMLHGFWDSALIANATMGVHSSIYIFIIYPLALISVAAILHKRWNHKLH